MNDALYLRGQRLLAVRLDELTGLTFDKIELGKLQTESRLKYWIDKIFPNWVYKRSIHTGDIQTYRDLVEKIIDNEKLGITAVCSNGG